MGRIVLFVAYLACVPVANWMIGHVGTTCAPDGPCLVPVGFGLLAPSGVMVAGFTLILRDLVQRRSGLKWSLAAMASGAALSFALAPPSLVIASSGAFIVSEVADMGVYTPLQRHDLMLAILASSLVGLAIDSAAFLWLAFGSLDHLLGQVVGKIWAVMFATTLIAASRKRPKLFRVLKSV